MSFFRQQFSPMSSNTPTSSHPAAPAALSAASKTGKSRKRLRWALITAAVALVVYAVGVRPILRSTSAELASANNRPVPVSTAQVQKADLELRLLALGTVTPLNTVTVRSRVDGQLQKLYFTEGQMVEAGAPLADIDPRPYEVQKRQVEAQAARDRALLENARLDLGRYQTLLEQDSVAKQSVDTQAALVRQYEATVALDEAEVASAALDLGYAHITAPLAGRVGLRQVDEGNMIYSSDTTGLVVITQLRPISVVFSVPQAALPGLLARFQRRETMGVEAYDRDGRTLLAKGELVTIDNQIDTTTGTVKLRAQFPNTDESLFPNQFVNVQLLATRLEGATVVAASAIQKGTIGSYVYAVDARQTVSVRSVETGATEDGRTVITKGLAPGEVVVVDGVDKLHEGSVVEIVGDGDGAGTAPAATQDDTSDHS